MTEKDVNVTVNVRDYMANGLDVFDLGGTKIGTVDDYDAYSGYMMVRPGEFAHHLLYIPFSIITHADRRELFVSKTRDEVNGLYRDPPSRSVLVEERTDPATGEDESRAITTEASGYGDGPVIVDMAEVGELAHHIALHFHVYSAELEELGRIKQYDRAAGRMVVEQGAFSKHDIVVPISFVSSVDRDRRAVYLSVGTKDLEGVKREKPDEMVSVTPGMAVYDVVAQKVGTVDSVTTGWFVVKTADFPPVALYIPFGLITQIDLQEVFLSLPDLELLHRYSSPPDTWNASR